MKYSLRLLIALGVLSAAGLIGCVATPVADGTSCGPGGTCTDGTCGNVSTDSHVEVTGS